MCCVRLSKNRVGGHGERTLSNSTLSALARPLIRASPRALPKNHLNEALAPASLGCDQINVWDSRQIPCNVVLLQEEQGRQIPPRRMSVEEEQHVVALWPMPHWP